MQSKTEIPSKNVGYLYAAVTLLIWAGFVVVSRIGGKSPLTVFDITALRIGTASLILSPFWFPRLLRPQLRQLLWNQALIVSLLAGIGFPLLAFVGMTLAPASHGAVLITGMLPFFTSLLAFIVYGNRLTSGRLAGLALILLGVSILLISNSANKIIDSRILEGDLVLLIASFIWSLFTVLIKSWGIRAFDVTLGVVATSAIIYLPVYIFFLPKHLADASIQQSLLQSFFQGFMVVCVALWSYAKATESLGAMRSVLIMSGVPVVGVILSVIFLGESLTFGIATGAVITVIGAIVGSLAQGQGANSSGNVSR